MSLASLHNKHVVITGASKGIGRALATECARRGARLTLCARTESAIDSLASEVAGLGGVVDVRDSHAVDAWLESGERHFGPIDVLVNNAAILGPIGPLADYPVEAFRDVLDVNVAGLFVVTRCALPRMSRPGGVLAHLTSFLGRNALPGYGAYCASKFAVEGIARLVAVEHEDLISCCVDPGMVQTDMLRAATSMDDVSEFPTAAEAASRFADLLERLDSGDTGTTQPLFEAG